MTKPEFILQNNRFEDDDLLCFDAEWVPANE